MTKQEFETLFRANYNAICNYAFALVHTREAAEDIVQEVLMALWNKLQNGEQIEKPDRYLIRATKFKCIDYLRKQASLRNSEESRVYTLSQQLAKEDNPNEDVDLQAVVTMAIAELPEKTRAVFNLAKMEGKSYKEVAEHLNISVKTVENQMSRALKQLRVKLKDHQFYMILNFLFFLE